MPWKVSTNMDEKVKFIGRVLDGEKISELCEEFGISRKTGYKIFDRYKSCGLDGVTDRSRHTVIKVMHAQGLEFSVSAASVH